VKPGIRVARPPRQAVGPRAVLRFSPAHLNGRVRPPARLEGHVEMLKAWLAVAQAVGAGDCQAGEGSRRVLGARGRVTSALAVAAHGLRLALPGAFPSTTPPRLFDQPSYPLKTPRSQARRGRTSASPRSRRQRSRRWSAATRGQLSLAGKRGHAGQHEDDACGQHDEGREWAIMGLSQTNKSQQPPGGRGGCWRFETTPGGRSFAIRLD
jgi:hypothetical protein